MATFNSNMFLGHNVGANFNINRHEVHRDGNKHDVPLSGCSTTDGAIGVFVHTRVRCVVRSGDHEAEQVRESKDVMVDNLKKTVHVPSGLWLAIYVLRDLRCKHMILDYIISLLHHTIVLETDLIITCMSKNIPTRPWSQTYICVESLYHPRGNLCNDKTSAGTTE